MHWTARFQSYIRQTPTDAAYFNEIENCVDQSNLNLKYMPLERFTEEVVIEEVQSFLDRGIMVYTENNKKSVVIKRLDITLPSSKDTFLEDGKALEDLFGDLPVCISFIKYKGETR